MNAMCIEMFKHSISDWYVEIDKTLKNFKLVVSYTMKCH